MVQVLEQNMSTCIEFGLTLEAVYNMSISEIIFYIEARANAWFKEKQLMLRSEDFIATQIINRFGGFKDGIVSIDKAFPEIFNYVDKYTRLKQDLDLDVINPDNRYITVGETSRFKELKQKLGR